MIRLGMFLGDRYEILEKIGSGGMSDVFKGKDHKLNRFVAIKVLKDEFVEDRNFVRKFKEEAQAAAGLAHPNIVNVYDVGDEQNIKYIVMELVEGITLKTYIEKKGKLTVKEATSIAIQVGAGLEIAHNNEIVHRDIKPQNIMISREGKVKVTDFGIAKSVSSNTNTSDAMGSVHYTSPEQARGGYSDAKSDIYSLGIVMYEMVTGRVPFDGETTVVIAVKHLQEDIVSPRVYASEIPVSLEHIILKCTEKSPDRRYSNVADLVADLKQSLITPDVNFVKEVLPGGARTVAISREEISKIQQETGRGSGERARGARQSFPEEFGEDNEEFFGGDDEEYDDDYEDDDYDDDYDDEEYDGEDEDDEDEEDEDGILDPKLEKIMTIGGIVAAVIIVIIIAVIIAKLFGFGKSPKKEKDNNEPQIEDVLDKEDESVEMPSLLGKSYSEAKEILNELGLGIELGETRSSDEYEPGQIISQSVEEGTEVEAHTTIKVDICGDGEEAEVPDVTNYTKSRAESALKELGFTVDSREEFDDKVEAGKVISTSPKVGTKVDRSSVITLIISKGSAEENETTVPKIEGMSESLAKSELTKANLKVGSVTQQYSDDVDEGIVISQSVRAGTKVDKDTSVGFVVSRGSEGIYIGNAEKNGSDEASVTKYLTDHGLKVSRSEQYHATVPKGNVISYSPGNGSTVKKGSTVNIVVSLGPEPVKTATVPDLRGKSVSEAQAAITNAGFKWGGSSNSTEKAPDVSQTGKVCWQSHSGTQNLGTTISVQVYVEPASCGDGNHIAPSGTGEGVQTTCTKCGRTFTTPVTVTPPDGGSGDNKDNPTS